MPEVKNLVLGFEGDFERTLVLAKQSKRVRKHPELYISDLFWAV